jgi:alanine dehydrogenase
MCGIAGISPFENDKDIVVIKKMVNSICHRGPDQENIFKNRLGIFGFLRLKIIDLSVQKLTELESEFGTSNIEYIKSSPAAILAAVKKTDLLIGAVYVVGKTAPKVFTVDMIKSMKPGSVFVDISIDQGGCSETSKPTTHDNPIYVFEDVVHYCVTNMPGSVPVTSTNALNRVTLPYIRKIAKHGLKDAFQNDPGLMRGLNIQDGKIVHQSVVDSLSID